MSDTYKRRPEASGTSGFAGARAKDSFAGADELDDKSAEDEYAKQQGATGIAGAGRRSKPEYKTGLEAFKAERKKKRTAGEAAEALAKRK